MSCFHTKTKKETPSKLSQLDKTRKLCFFIPLSHAACGSVRDFFLCAHCTYSLSSMRMNGTLDVAVTEGKEFYRV